MNNYPSQLQRVGLLLLLLCVLIVTISTSGCATPRPVEIPVAVECPHPPKIHPDMLKPTPTQYLLPKELQRTAPKPQ